VAGFRVQSQGSRYSRCTVSLLQDAADLHRIPFNSAYAAPIPRPAAPPLNLPTTTDKRTRHNG
jgi:hypothetical protein